MMRFSGPAGISAISLSSGPIDVVGGFADVPDDATAEDLAGLTANGFKAAPTKEDFERADKARAIADAKAAEETAQ